MCLTGQDTSYKVITYPLSHPIYHLSYTTIFLFNIAMESLGGGICSFLRYQISVISRMDTHNHTRKIRQRNEYFEHKFLTQL